MNISVRRWQIEIYRRAILLIRGPHPECPICAGHGGIEVYTLGPNSPETELCDCWDPTPAIRIPLWFRRTERAPF